MNNFEDLFYRIMTIGGLLFLLLAIISLLT